MMYVHFSDHFVFNCFFSVSVIDRRIISGTNLSLNICKLSLS